MKACDGELPSSSHRDEPQSKAKDCAGTCPHGSGEIHDLSDLDIEIRIAGLRTLYSLRSNSASWRWPMDRNRRPAAELHVIVHTPSLEHLRTSRSHSLTITLLPVEWVPLGRKQDRRWGKCCCCSKLGCSTRRTFPTQAARAFRRQMGTSAHRVEHAKRKRTTTCSPA